MSSGRSLVSQKLNENHYIRCLWLVLLGNHLTGLQLHNNPQGLNMRTLV